MHLALCLLTLFCSAASPIFDLHMVESTHTHTHPPLHTQTDTHTHIQTDYVWQPGIAIFPIRSARSKQLSGETESAARNVFVAHLNLGHIPAKDASKRIRGQCTKKKILEKQKKPKIKIKSTINGTKWKNKLKFLWKYNLKFALRVVNNEKPVENLAEQLQLQCKWNEN